MATPIKESDVTFNHDNDVLKAFLARPEQPGKYPTVIAIHEIYGVNEAMRDIARRFARESYVCLAVDLFSAGNKLRCIAQTIGAIIDGANDNIGTRRLKSGLDFLCQQEFVDKTKLGAIGFCMGGNFAISLSCEDKRIKTIAPFYSTNPNLDEVASLCPVIGSYPALDFTSVAGKTLEKKLQKANVPHDIKVYDWAFHSFMDTCYNAQVADDAWRRTIEFFSIHINSSQTDTTAKSY